MGGTKSGTWVCGDPLITLPEREEAMGFLATADGKKEMNILKHMLPNKDSDCKWILGACLPQEGEAQLQLWSS